MTGNEERHDGAIADGIEEHIKATVREWHPKCETCDTWLNAPCFILNEAMKMSNAHPKNFGCLEHTALRGEGE